MPRYMLLIMTIATLGIMPANAMDTSSAAATSAIPSSAADQLTPIDYSKIGNEDLSQENFFFNANFANLMDEKNICAALQFLYHIPDIRNYLLQPNTATLYEKTSPVQTLITIMNKIKNKQTQDINSQILTLQKDFKDYESEQRKNHAKSQYVLIDENYKPFFYLINNLVRTLTQTDSDSPQINTQFAGLKTLFWPTLAKKNNEFFPYTQPLSNTLQIKSLIFTKKAETNSLSTEIQNYINNKEQCTISQPSTLFFSIVTTKVEYLFGRNTAENPISDVFSVDTNSYTIDPKTNTYAAGTFKYQLIGLYTKSVAAVFTRQNTAKWMIFSTTDSKNLEITNREFIDEISNDCEEFPTKQDFLLIYQRYTGPDLSADPAQTDAERIADAVTALTALREKLEALSTQLGELKEKLAELKKAIPS